MALKIARALQTLQCRGLSTRHFANYSSAGNITSKIIAPVEDFSFETDQFSQLALDLCDESWQEKKSIVFQNESLIQKLQMMACQNDPFEAVLGDLVTTK